MCALQAVYTGSVQQTVCVCAHQAVHEGVWFIQPMVYLMQCVYVHQHVYGGRSVCSKGVCFRGCVYSKAGVVSSLSSM